MRYLTLFVSGVVLEFAVFYILMISDSEVTKRELALAVLAINLLTHPLLIFIVPITGLQYLPTIFVAEAVIMLCEGYALTTLFRDMSSRRIYVASVFANLASWQLSPFLLYIVSLL